MPDSFVEYYLPPNRYAGSAEVFQVFVYFVSRFSQLKAGVPQTLFSFIAHRAASAKRRVFEFLLVAAIKGASPSAA
jgi:hypothetical protein